MPSSAPISFARTRGAVTDKIKVKMIDVISIIFGATIVSLRGDIGDVAYLMGL